MSITLYHNPKCSKSREALALLQESGAEFTVREYLRDPLSEEELLSLLGKLRGEMSAAVRTKEEKYRELNFSLNKESIAKNLASHPELLERPIAVKGGLAVVGRPIENLKEIIKAIR
jgi:arsenate reductase